MCSAATRSASANLSDVDSTLANYSTELQVIDREARKTICENSTGIHPFSLRAVMYLAREKKGEPDQDHGDNEALS